MSESSRHCRFCGTKASRWWPYCTTCDSLYGFPVVGWVIVLFLAVGVYAMFFRETVAALRSAH